MENNNKKDWILEKTGLKHYPHPYIPVKALAEALGLSCRSLYREMDRGNLGYVKYGKKRRIPLEDAQKYAINNYYPA